jgi:hypothetical protein
MCNAGLEGEEDADVAMAGRPVFGDLEVRRRNRRKEGSIWEEGALVLRSSAGRLVRDVSSGMRAEQSSLSETVLILTTN